MPRQEETGVNHNDKLVKEVDYLRQQHEELSLKMKQERVLWILTSLVLLDFLAFPSLQNWAAALVIGLLEVILILFAAPRCWLGQIKAIFSPLKKNDE